MVNKTDTDSTFRVQKCCRWNRLNTEQNTKYKYIILNYGKSHEEEQGHSIYMEECSRKVSLKWCWGQKEERMGEGSMRKGRKEQGRNKSAELMSERERSVRQRWEADGGQIKHGVCRSCGRLWIIKVLNCLTQCFYLLTLSRSPQKDVSSVNVCERKMEAGACCTGQPGVKGRKALRSMRRLLEEALRMPETMWLGLVPVKEPLELLEFELESEKLRTIFFWLYWGRSYK